MTTKAEVVRSMILAAKVEGKEPKDIIEAVMEFGGFKRGLARAYINNNWPKVLTPEEQEAIAVAKASLEATVAVETTTAELEAA